MGGHLVRLRILTDLDDADIAVSGTACRIVTREANVGDLAATVEMTGASPAIISVMVGSDRPFSFFVRDVTAAHPVWVPDCRAAVVPGEDARDYVTVVRDIRAVAGQSDRQRWAAEPEESFASAAARTRPQFCPTWLGLGRDMRIFRFHYQELPGYWGHIEPAWHSKPVPLPDSETPLTIQFVVGVGCGPAPRLRRRLDGGVLPILTGTQDDDDIRYSLTAFATLEIGPVKAASVRGTDWRAAYACSGGHMLGKEEYADLAELLTAEQQHEDGEMICAVRIRAVNLGNVPRYAWFKAPHVAGHAPTCTDGVVTAADCGIAACRLDGEPLPKPEVAILLQPGAAAEFEMFVPHRPLSPDRVHRLLSLDFDAHLAATRKWWRERLGQGASISLPETAIDERVRAGLLHLDLATIGKLEQGPLLATIGWYAPIGSESAPIIQFFDSMGWHDVAERCLDFFLARQQDDGFIQNFAGYQLETGPVLWSMGEHFRYTRDLDWVRRVRPNVDKAVAYLLAWRARNMRDEQRQAGCYGLLDGKVADPEDYYHSYFLNAVSYIGVARAAEMLAAVDPEAGERLAAEAAAWRTDLRVAVAGSLERAPVVPLGDGSWVPLLPPWTEHQADVSLCPDDGCWFTHGSFASRSQMIGALWLVIGEVLDPDEPAVTALLDGNEIWATENAARSQPYYARHDYAHLRRGEVGAFLKTWYNQLAGLQDRETYTFWEHYYHCSQHKTHEEGWFLMQTRWMLWIEEAGGLSLLKAVPRDWLAPGKVIELYNVVSHFGRLNLRVESRADGIVATVASELQPAWIDLRLPHPEGRQAVRVEGGTWDPARETLRLAPGIREVRIAW